MVRKAAAVSVSLVLVACSDGSGGRTAGSGSASSPVSPCEQPAPVAAPPPINQPPQPACGPGGADYTNGDWRVNQGGVGNEVWYLFEPIDPQPASAPVAIIMHGYYEFSGYDSLYELIRHTVRKGSIVIYPRWQTNVSDPCPGPYDIEPCIGSAVNAIHGALADLQADPTRVQPELDHTSYFGFSFGGIITSDMLNRYQALGLPEPKAIMLDDPHDSGVNGFGEPALDDSLDGIPPTVKFECHNGAQGVIAEAGKADSSCNAVFPKLGHIPDVNKGLVLTEPDNHGTPPLNAVHGVCAGRQGEANAYDWGFCWKVWDALRSCALTNTNCQYALGDTPEHRANGTWSDGVPVAPLKIAAVAPIRP